jgi:hypothetical protein
MRRFSIRNLMVFVLAIAVAFAALRGANEYWAGGLVLAVLFLLGYSILRSIHTQGQARAASLGFLILAGGYFLALRALPAQESAWLPTSQLLAYVERQVIGDRMFTVNFTTGGTITTTATTATLAAPTPATPGGNMVVFSNPATTAGSVRVWNSQTPSGATWAPFLPGAANGEAFKSVGHCFFALLMGWVGIVISKRMFARREAGLEIANTPMAPETSNVI